MSVSRETVGWDVPRETCERLNLYVSLLLRWNATINLIGRATESEIWPRHIADSLQLVPHIPTTATTIADLGSGAGLPGVVLSIATGIPAHLVEADQRKAAFLREAVRVTRAPATIHAERLDVVQLPPVDVITARALAPLSQLLSWAAPCLAKSGICLFLKGARAEEELADALHAWTMRVERHISRTDRTGVILRISEVARA